MSLVLTCRNGRGCAKAEEKRRRARNICSWKLPFNQFYTKDWLSVLPIGIRINFNTPGHVTKLKLSWNFLPVTFLTLTLSTIKLIQVTMAAHNSQKEREASFIIKLYRRNAVSIEALLVTTYFYSINNNNCYQYYCSYYYYYYYYY